MTEPKFRFDEIMKQLSKDILEASPMLATQLGCHDYDHLLHDPSPEGRKRCLELKREALEKIEALELLEQPELEEDKKLDHELLLWDKSLEAFYLEKAKIHLKSSNPVEEFAEALHPLFAREYAPLQERCEAMISRLRGAPRFFAKSKECFRNPVDVFVEEQINCSRQSALLIDEIVDNISPRLSSTFSEDLESCAKIAKESLEDFSDWLSNDVLPRASSNVSLGRELFEELLDSRRLGFSLEEIREIGRSEFQRLQKECQGESAKLCPGSTFEETIAELNREGPKDFQEIIQAYEEAISLARNLVEEHSFATIPENEELVVEATPIHLESSIPSAAYFPPEGYAREPYRGTYLVTEPKSKEQFAEHYPASIVNVSFHEAYPGHHLQALRAIENPSPFRPLIQGLEFIEGWAHYCEEEMYELAPETKRGLRLAQLCDARYRALRVELDIGLHCGDIDFQQGQAMMAEKLGVSKETARAEITWYCQAPSYALSYLMGKVLLRRLRKKAEEMQKDSFQSKVFHDHLLFQGNLPCWAQERALANLPGVDV